MSGSAARTRAWRKRETNGRRLLRVEIDEVGLTCALVDFGLLDLNHADDPAALTAATEQVLSLLSDTSRPADGVFDMLRARLCLQALRRKQAIN